MSHFPVEIKEGYLVSVMDSVHEKEELQLVSFDQYDHLVVGNHNGWTQVSNFDNEDLTTGSGWKLMKIYGRSFGTHCWKFDTVYRDLLWERDKANESIEAKIDLSDCKNFKEVIDKGTKYFEDECDMTHEDAEAMTKWLSSIALITSLMDLNK